MQFLKPKGASVPASTAPEQTSGARRSFFGRAAVATAGAAALGVPMVSRAQTVSFRFQSTWPAKDIFHEYANDFAKKINDMAGPRLRIEVLPAGAVVRAFDLLDAVSKGTLDGGHGVVAYWYGKSTAVALWGSGPAFGLNANQVLAWHYYGGGKELLDGIYRGLNINVQSFLYGPMPTQPLGWFRKPITRVEDFRGLKFRTVGLAVDIFTDLGAAVNPLPGGEIVPALDRGLLDAAEFNNATSDRILGFQDVAKNCMLQSFHQSGEQFEVLFNKPKYDALPAELKAVIDYAVQAASADMSWKAEHRYSQDYIELRTKHGVSFFKTPDSILRAQLAAWDRVVARRSAENPLFRQVFESQRVFAERVGRWHFDTNVDFRMAFNHYFARPAAPAKKAPAKK